MFAFCVHHAFCNATVALRGCVLIIVRLLHIFVGLQLLVTFWHVVVHEPRGTWVRCVLSVMARRAC